MKRILFLVLSTLMACSSNSTAPSPPAFPDVAGAYGILGRFDGVSDTDAHFTGVLTLAQPSRDVGTLTGNISVTLTISGSVATAQGPIFDAVVSPGGTVSFHTQGPSGSWTFSGNISSNGIVSGGRHTISTSSGTASGSWEGSRHL